METPQAPIPETFRKMTLVVAIIIASIFGILILTITSFIIHLRIVDWQEKNLDNKMFQKYEVFSHKIMPSNFTLIESQELPGSIDTSNQLVQTFRVSSTRKEVIEQLQPIFQRNYFRTVNLYTTRELGTSSQVVYYHDIWSLTNSKTGIWINFFPADPLNRPAQFPTSVEEIKIRWVCEDSLQTCSEDKDLSL